MTVGLLFRLDDAERACVHDEECLRAWLLSPDGWGDVQQAYCRHHMWWQPREAAKEAWFLRGEEDDE